MDLQMAEWLYYNIDAARFHAKKLCSRLYSTEIGFYLKTFLSHLLGDSSRPK